MALLTYEGFDYFKANDLWFLEGWVNTSGGLSLQKGSGRYSGSSSLLFGNQGFGIRYTIPSGSFSTLIAGCNFRYNQNALTSTGPCINFVDNGTGQFGWGITTNVAGNHLVVFRGTTATIVATGTTSLVSNTWYQIDFKVLFGGAGVGAYTLRINNVVELSGTGVQTITTANSNANQCTVTGSGSGMVSLFDDFYLLNDQAPAPNDFLPNWQVETVWPLANYTVQWTPLTSTNISQIDETDMDSDTTYNWSKTNGDIDLFTMNSLSIQESPVFIYGCMLVVAYKKDDISVQSMRTKFVSGPVTTNGTPKDPAVFYGYDTELFLVDTNTPNAPWTVSSLNGIKIGYEHV